MINNPDIQPNASMNRWIVAILLFNFKLRHVPGSKHASPDGISRHRRSPDDNKIDETPQEIDERLDDVVSCGIWIADTVQQEGHCLVSKVVKGRAEAIDDNKTPEIPTKQETLDKFTRSQEIHTFLETLQPPKDLSQSQLTSFLRQASRYFVTGGKLC